MNLIFNAEALRPPITGVGHYSYHLLQQFVQGDAVARVHCFNGTQWLDGESQVAATAMQMQSQQGSAGALATSVQALRTAVGWVPGTKAVYDHLMDRRFSTYAGALSDAVYHETNYILKPYEGACVTTVHDLSHVRHPEFHKPFIVNYLNKHLPRSIARADHVIAVSEVVRREILDHFPVAEDRVSTIYEGVDEAYRPREAAECQSVLAQYGLGYKQYVLMVATLEPRKGIETLLNAWQLLPEQLQEQYPLVLTGSSGWRNSALRDKLEPMLAQGTVKHLGYVPGPHLPPLFSGASVFSYPSVYEGFGLPVLDAMSSAVPVICRAGTSMAEFADGACLLCETAEPEELAEKLSLLLQDEQQRLHWGEHGLRVASGFSWQRCAQQTADIYRKVL